MVRSGDCRSRRSADAFEPGCDAGRFAFGFVGDQVLDPADIKGAVQVRVRFRQGCGSGRCSVNAVNQHIFSTFDGQSISAEHSRYGGSPTPWFADPPP